MAIAVKINVIFGEPASLTEAHTAEKVGNSSCQKAESVLIHLYCVYSTEGGEGAEKPQ